MRIDRLFGVGMLTALVLTGLGPVRGEPDDTQQAWFDRVRTATRWDNVEGAPEWVGGIRPSRRMGSSLHLVDLRPGGRVIVRLPAGERLGVYNPDGALATEDLRLRWSTGTGLLAETAGWVVSGRQSVVADPPVRAELLLEILRPPEADSSLQLALFVSRPGNQLDATSYRELLAPLGAMPKVEIGDRYESKSYWAADPSRPYLAEVHGPTRVEIRTRLALFAGGEPVNQSYRLYAYLDDQMWRVVDLATSLATSETLALDGCVQPVAGEVSAFLDIPSGNHRLEVRTRRQVYIRALARARADDYLFDGNRPMDYPHTVGMTAIYEPANGFWDSAEDTDVMLQEQTRQPSSVGYRTAGRVAQDNGRRHGGLAGGMALYDWPRFAPGQRGYAALADRRLRLHTFYRSLVPETAGGPSQGFFARFLTFGLHEDFSRLVLPEAYAEHLAGAIASGYFTLAPAGRDRALVFRLPDRGTDTLLRIAADRSGHDPSGPFYLQFDQREPLRLSLESAAAVPPEALRASRAAAGLAMLNRRHGVGGWTLSGPFGAIAKPGPLLSTGHLEIPLPQGINTLRLWRESTGQHPLRVALAYRDSRVFELPEFALLSLLDVLGPEMVQRLFREALQWDPNSEAHAFHSIKDRFPKVEPEQLDALVDLHNQLLPLLRLVHARAGVFGADVFAGEPLEVGARLSTAAAEKLKQQAQLAEGERDWLRALDSWSELRRGSAARLRGEASLGQVRALEAMGNRYLAGRLLRQAFLYSADPALRSTAQEQLMADSTRRGDRNGALNLLAAAIRREPRSELMQALAEQLLHEGRERLALLALLTLPPEQRAQDVLLALAYRQGWWSLFESALEDLADPVERKRWEGYRAQALGDYEQALAQWEQMGIAGVELVERLKSALEIRAGLASSDASERARALARWEAESSHPAGPQLWTGAPELVTEHAGGALLYAVDQARYTQAFRADPDAPVRMAVYGPNVLRFRIRPVHAAGSDAPVNDWVLVRSGGDQVEYPITDNRITRGLRLPGEHEIQLGQAVEFVYEVSGGPQNLVLKTEHSAVVVGIEVRRPWLPLRVLPELTTHTARAAALGLLMPDAEKGGARGPSRPEVEWIGACKVRSGLDLDPPLVAVPPERSTSFTGRPAEKPRSGEAQLAVGRILWSPEAATKRSSRNDSWVTERLVQLLWQAEHDPGAYASALAEAEGRYRSHPGTPGGERILRRLRKSVAWEWVRNAQGGAGVRLVEISDWQPEDPGLRTRKALMGPSAPGEQVLSGHGTLVFSVQNQVATQFLIRLTMEDVGFPYPQPMTVLYALDEEPEQTLILAPEEPVATLAQTLGTGSHALRIRIRYPIANQYLRIKVQEPGAAAQEPVTETLARVYDLAIPKQPLVYYVQGPTLLRIDQWQDGWTRSRYQPLGPGWQQVVVAADAGRSEGLFRVYRQTLDPKRKLVATRPSRYHPNEVPAATLDRVHPPRGARQSLHDGLTLGGQEDGTWSYGATVANRRGVDEEPTESLQPERYAAARIAYRFFDGPRAIYYYADGQFRARQEGSPTLGLRGRLGIRRPDWPLDVDLHASLFLQNVDETGRLESASTLRGRVSKRLGWTEKIYHRPYVSLFKRWLSLEDYPDKHPERLDQDLFTRYKGDHKQGLRIGDRVVLRPRLDSLLYGGVAVASNEDFSLLDPDHLRLRAGARQLLGALDLSLDYSWYRYFSDNDREDANDNGRLRLDVDALGWWSPRNGWQTNFRYEYDQDSGDSSFWFSLIWNRANGRYYRDFLPSDLGFLPLRSRQALEQEAQGTGD